MKQKELAITNDYIFKKIFTKEGNESVLKDLLIAILDMPIEKVKVQAEVSLEKELEENKLGRLDIVAILNDNTIVNIELQVVNRHNIIERAMFYWSGLYYNDLKAGDEYEQAKKTISINILDYNEFEEGPYHEIVRLKRDFENKVLTDKMELHFIQIPKFNKEKRGVETKLEQWMHYISKIDDKGVELAMKENKEIRKANNDYKILIGDEYERRLAYLRDKAIRDENSLKRGAREEGAKEEKIKIAKKLLKLGIAIEQIIEVTELTKEEIKRLR